MYDLALESLKTLASKSSDYSPMYADMLFATGDTDTAVEVYTDYLLANPGDLDSMLRLGNIFRQCGSVEGVVWTMGYILDKDPANQAAQQILSEISTPTEPTPTEP
jgi:predicted TPR repeat methyltransferase